MRSCIKRFMRWRRALSQKLYVVAAQHQCAPNKEQTGASLLSTGIFHRFRSASWKNMRNTEITFNSFIYLRGTDLFNNGMRVDICPPSIIPHMMHFCTIRSICWRPTLSDRFYIHRKFLVACYFAFMWDTTFQHSVRGQSPCRLCVFVDGWFFICLLRLISLVDLHESLILLRCFPKPNASPIQSDNCDTTLFSISLITAIKVYFLNCIRM